MADSDMNYVFSPFEGKLNTGDPQVIKFYLQAKKEIDKESYKLYISVLNAKDIIDHFLNLAKTYASHPR